MITGKYRVCKLRWHLHSLVVFRWVTFQLSWRCLHEALVSWYRSLSTFSQPLDMSIGNTMSWTSFLKSEVLYLLTGNVYPPPI